MLLPPQMVFHHRQCPIQPWIVINAKSIVSLIYLKKEHTIELDILWQYEILRRVCLSSILIFTLDLYSFLRCTSEQYFFDWFVCILLLLLFVECPF